MVKQAGSQGEPIEQYFTGVVMPGLNYPDGLGKRWSMAGSIALGIILLYLLIATLVFTGVIAQQWDHVSNDAWAAPSLEHWLGTNRIGQDILDRALYGVMTALTIGFSVAFLSVLLGGIVGGFAAYYRNRMPDQLVQFVMNLIDAIPFYLLVILLANFLDGIGYSSILAMVICFWTTSARIIRSEVIRMNESEFMKITRLLRFSVFKQVVVHMLPNLRYLLLVQFVIVFVVAIKTEVVLSFLGLGIVSGVSWGVMVAESITDIGTGHYYNFIAATAALFTLVLSFNILLDKNLARVH